MCGLMAGIGKLNGNRIIALGSLNESRGTDSVGLAYLQDGNIKIAKKALRPCVALNLDLKREVTEAAMSGMFIGHTRWATQGKVNDDNAHPFLMDGIAFAHNGIVLNDDKFGDYEVDSQSLIHGIKRKDFSKYEGSIALVWIEDGKLKAYRKGNPLFRGKFGDGLYLASEKKHLEIIGCTKIKELAEGMIYTFYTPTVLKTQKVKTNKSGVVLVSRANYKDDFKEDFSTYEDDRKKTLSESYLDQLYWWNVEEDMKDTPPYKCLERGF